MKYIPSKSVIEYDSFYLAERDSPALYYFDEATQCYEAVDSAVGEDGTVTASFAPAVM